MDDITEFLLKGLFDLLSDFFLSIINAPIKPILAVIKSLLYQPPNIQAFGSLWAVIIYMISLFYGVFILIAGFNFIISGQNAERRENAKQWLQNVILMMLFVQASFLIYSLISELASAMTSSIVGIIDPNFFLFTLDNLSNVFLEISLGIFYVAILFITVLVFSINYLLASIGVLLFPFGIFFYFIPPLRDIGKFIISTIIFILFLPFFASIVLVGASELVKVGSFDMIKIVLMIGAFALVNILMILLAVLAVFGAVTGVMRADVTRGIMLLKGHFNVSQPQPKPLHNDREYWGKFRKDYYERRP